MGYVQTKEYEAEHCQVPITRDELIEVYGAMIRLSRIDRYHDDERSADRLKALADQLHEVIDLAHPRRIHFKLCPRNIAW